MSLTLLLEAANYLEEKDSKNSSSASNLLNSSSSTSSSGIASGGSSPNSSDCKFPDYSSLSSSNSSATESSTSNEIISKKSRRNPSTIKRRGRRTNHETTVTTSPATHEPAKSEQLSNPASSNSRLMHNEVERLRRAFLRTCFERLRSTLNLDTPEGKKMSMGELLRIGVDEIRVAENEQTSLANQRSQLEKRIKLLQGELNAARNKSQNQVKVRLLKSPVAFSSNNLIAATQIKQEFNHPHAMPQNQQFFTQARNLSNTNSIKCGLTLQRGQALPQVLTVNATSLSNGQSFTTQNAQQLQCCITPACFLQIASSANTTEMSQTRITSPTFTHPSAVDSSKQNAFNSASSISSNIKSESSETKDETNSSAIAVSAVASTVPFTTALNCTTQAAFQQAIATSHNRQAICNQLSPAALLAAVNSASNHQGVFTIGNPQASMFTALCANDPTLTSISKRPRADSSASTATAPSIEPLRQRMKELDDR